VTIVVGSGGIIQVYLKIFCVKNLECPEESLPLSQREVALF
jgi:hypothetical protein